MHIRKPLLSPAFLLLVAACALNAAVPGKSFVMRTTEPVVVYNTLLAPGTHIWRLMDSSSNRHIVQISNQATDRVEAVILAIPKYRQTVTSTNEVQFWETPVGYARAVRTWFSPGDNSGQEFPYSRKAMLTLGRLTVSAQQTGEKPAVVTEPHREKIAQASVKTRPSTQWPEGSWAIITDGVPGAPSAQPAAAETAPQTRAKQAGGLWDTIKRLPMTATIAPLIGLIGVGFLIMFVLIQVRRRGRPVAQPR